MINDSPSHCKEFTNSQYSDSFPNGSPKGILTKNVMQKMRKMNIEFIFASILDQTKLMEDIFKRDYDKQDENKTMSIIRLIDANAVKSSTVKKHFIFSQLS